MKRALFIAGPTASGKSAFAMKTAAAYDGIIINADSMQVYRDLSVISACPSAAEQKQVTHRLYGFLDATEICSAAFWAEKAMAEIRSAWATGKLPILVGGTGMYFKVLIDGIAKIPDIPADVRAQVRRECQDLGSEALYTELTVSDPITAARLAPGDSQRVSRAIEVVRSTGIPLSDWQKDTKPGPMQSFDEAGEIGKYVVLPDREELYARCDHRFDQMMEQGAIEEVRALVGRNLRNDLPIMRALGVPSLARYLAGETTYDQAADDAKMQTRRFAKRQLTWFRNQFSHWKMLNAQYSESYFDKLVAKIFKK